jgi:RNA polymerase sigma factor (sigma-70 family)
MNVSRADSVARRENTTAARIADSELLERFVARRDEAAFAELVRRHGGGVWTVCSRLLSQPQDVEDAFQAVFLVLARKAGSIRKGEAVGSWLYGVAYRTAERERRNAASRREHEKRAASPVPEPAPSAVAACRELQQLLHDEVQRLPAKLRTPFVLCCLHGQSKSEAARELGWKEGTVASRLAEARRRLRVCLARRGVALAAALTAAALGQGTAGAAPAELVQTTTCAALTGTGRPEVVVLAESMVQAMAASKLSTALPLIAALLLLASGVALAAFQNRPTQEPGDAPGAKRVSDLAPIEKGALPRGVTCAALSCEGRTLATGTDGIIEIRNLDGKGECRTVPIHVPGLALLALNPDASMVATVAMDDDGAVRTWDTRSGKPGAVLRGQRGEITCLGYSPDGKMLAVAGGDRFKAGELRLWDVAHNIEFMPITGIERRVWGLAIAPDSTSVTVASGDGTVSIIDPATGKVQRSLPHPAYAHGLAYSPDSKRLAVGYGDKGEVRIYELPGARITASLKAPAQKYLGQISFSPDGSRMLALCIDRTALVWDLRRPEIPTATLKGHEGPIRFATFVAGGRDVVTVGDDRTIRTWDLTRISDGQKGAILPPDRAASKNDIVTTPNRSAGGEKPPATKSDQEKDAAFRAKDSYAIEWYHSFTEKAGDHGAFNLIGPDAASCVQFDPAGLRITLPTGYAGKRFGTGVACPLEIRGDFEITATYELLREPEAAKAGQGTGLFVGVDLNTVADNRATLTRGIRDATQFMTWFQLSDEADGKPLKDELRVIAATANKGKLRLVRTGPVLASYVAEDPGKDFVLLRHHPFSTADVKHIRLGAQTGGPDASLEALVLDLRVRADALLDQPAASVPVGSLRGLLGALLIVVLALGTCLLLGVRLYRNADHREQSAAAAPAIVFSCSQCGQRVKAKPAFTGKKVRCPQCGHALLVPKG